jgi:hypothetical protein
LHVRLSALRRVESFARAYEDVELLFSPIPDATSSSSEVAAHARCEISSRLTTNRLSILDGNCLGCAAFCPAPARSRASSGTFCSLRESSIFLLNQG